MATMLTAHFSLEELTTSGKHPSIENLPPESLAGNGIKIAEKLEQARSIWGVPVLVTYAYRGDALNNACGGSSTSVHREFLAADTVPLGLDLDHAFDQLVADRAFMSDVDQLIIERGCIHIGLPGERQNYHPRHELRKDAMVDGVRRYPLIGIWTPEGVRNG
jgi:zinc D-Ala-D-Ala carboxypeptidase